ncbi:NDT80/PhoG like DNA-binding family protein [Dictyocaulus viviparus]|uniref:NDT80/PhoG like DNA-binding family protein n=1 Tax=Dictyocaulus viviparus TaxID=29172 RepID=A0A0D8XP21_DICVI|nr:NDT80/PhoG like DNA-binding family protein [Dictyocaulus viviparus]
MYGQSEAMLVSFTPLDSPDTSRHTHPNNERNVQGVGHNTQQHSHTMFQNATRLPESPPITDISGAGSSGSPESNSDAPYSPENYPNYVGIHGNINNNGLILGVPGMMAHELHQPSHGPVAHTMTSPQNACFMSPYPPSQPTPGSLPQVSPPVSNSCHDNQQYRVNNGYSAGLFNILNVSSDGCISNHAGEAPRKRPRTENQLLDPPKFLPTFPTVGQTPVAASPIDCSYQDENFSQQVIKFSPFQEELWNPLYDINHQQLTKLKICVVADKGFNYSNSDGCFVNQKKNHFQISVNIEAKDENPPKFVKVNGVMHPIKAIKLAFCGVKAEMLSSEIQIKQSQTDRKPIPHDPVIGFIYFYNSSICSIANSLSLNIHAREITKVTVPRLHFSETTLNNQRKNNRPNPDQKYFLLVVRLLACTDDGAALIQAQQSEKVIVRATNPGSFEPPESDVQWYRNGGTLVCHGPVAIGTDRTAAKLTVDGDIYITGQINRPSDIRLKEDIVEKTSRDALEHLQQLRIVDFRYKPEIADLWGLSEEQRRRTGLIAQELQAVLPDAVRDIGTHLTIDESRIFYETVLAMQELCRLTGDLDTKIDDKVEEISQRLARYARRKKLIGSIASNLSEQSSGIVSDNKSFLSYSRTSLASTAPSINKESHEKRKTRTCRTHCHRPDPVCHSKLTQGTIIALVAVMAACLIAMSALYVLDWHNRNYGYHHLYPPNATPPTKFGGSTEGVGHMIYQIDHPYLPMLQPNAPPLMSTCRSTHCYTYCCADNIKYHTDSQVNELDTIVTLGDKAKNMVARSAPDNSVGKPLGSGVRITIPSLNMTIDSRYCIEQSCNKKRGRFNMYIPVSPYLPTIPLEIVFSVPKGKLINNCGYLADFQHKYCAFDNDNFKAERLKNPMANQIFEDTFELSVGSYLQSAYRFRVGFTTESCFSSEDHLHGGYEEYNLIFYRTCAPKATVTDMPSV